MYNLKGQTLETIEAGLKMKFEGKFEQSVKLSVQERLQVMVAFYEHVWKRIKEAGYHEVAGWHCSGQVNVNDHKMSFSFTSRNEPVICSWTGQVIYD